jgi:Telomere resolvase
MEVLRSRLNTAAMTNQNVHDRYSKYVGRAVSRIFTDHSGVPLTPSELRKAYATTACAWYCPSTLSMNAYFARILGHSPLDLYTSMSYVLFWVFRSLSGTAGGRARHNGIGWPARSDPHCGIRVLDT